MCDLKAEGGRRCSTPLQHGAERTVARAENRAENRADAIDTYVATQTSGRHAAERPASYPCRVRSRFRVLLAQMLSAIDRAFEARGRERAAEKDQWLEDNWTRTIEGSIEAVRAADLQVALARAAVAMDESRGLLDRRTELAYQVETLQADRVRLMAAEAEARRRLTPVDEKPAASGEPTAKRAAVTAAVGSVLTNAERLDAVRTAWSTTLTPAQQFTELQIQLETQRSVRAEHERLCEQVRNERASAAKLVPAGTWGVS